MLRSAFSAPDTDTWDSVSADTDTEAKKADRRIPNFNSKLLKYLIQQCAL